MKTRPTLTMASAILCGTALLTSPAAADWWPASIAGTWNIVADQSVGQLIINQPASAHPCKPITGTILGQPLQGFYCPGSGRITFFRYQANSKTADEFYSANLSDAIAGQPLRMAGSFATRSDLDPPGEYAFYGTK